MGYHENLDLPAKLVHPSQILKEWQFVPPYCTNCID